MNYNTKRKPAMERGRARVRCALKAGTDLTAVKLARWASDWEGLNYAEYDALKSFTRREMKKAA